MPNQSPFSTHQLLGVYCSSSILRPRAESLSSELDKPLLSTLPAKADTGFFMLVVDEQGLSLQATGKKAPGPILVDFAHGANAHRRQFGGGKGQMIAKALGIKGAFRPHVLDVTAGLGQDGFVLATLGCEMTWVERSPIVYQLLSDGVSRAALIADPSLQEIMHRIHLHHAHSVDYLQALTSPVDVIYLDPMFPERKSKAEVNKSMKAFHSLVGEDNDAGELLAEALTKAMYRVVVKRPRKAPTISEQFPLLALPEPNVVYEGKSTRFDVYTLKKMP